MDCFGQFWTILNYHNYQNGPQSSKTVLTIQNLTYFLLSLRTKTFHNLDQGWMGVITPSIYQFLRQLPATEDAPLIIAVRELAVSKPKVVRQLIQLLKC